MEQIIYYAVVFTVCCFVIWFAHFIGYSKGYDDKLKKANVYAVKQDQILMGFVVYNEQYGWTVAIGDNSMLGEYFSSKKECVKYVLQLGWKVYIE